MRWGASVTRGDGLEMRGNQGVEQRGDASGAAGQLTLKLLRKKTQRRGNTTRGNSLPETQCLQPWGFGSLGSLLVAARGGFRQHWLRTCIILVGLSPWAIRFALQYIGDHALARARFPFGRI